MAKTASRTRPLPDCYQFRCSIGDPCPYPYEQSRPWGCPTRVKEEREQRARQRATRDERPAVTKSLPRTTKTVKESCCPVCGQHYPLPPGWRLECGSCDNGANWVKLVAI